MSLQESLLEEGGSGEKTFYGSDEDEEEDEEEKEKKAEAAAMAKRKPYVMDPDHRLLLRNTKPLLQSRNAAVGPLHSEQTSLRLRTAEPINSPLESVAMAEIIVSSRTLLYCTLSSGLVWHHLG